MSAYDDKQRKTEMFQEEQLRIQREQLRYHQEHLALEKEKIQSDWNDRQIAEQRRIQLIQERQEAKRYRKFLKWANRFCVRENSHLLSDDEVNKNKEIVSLYLETEKLIEELEQLEKIDMSDDLIEFVDLLLDKNESRIEYFEASIGAGMPDLIFYMEHGSSLIDKLDKAIIDSQKWVGVYQYKSKAHKYFFSHLQRIIDWTLLEVILTSPLLGILIQIIWWIGSVVGKIPSPDFFFFFNFTLVIIALRLFVGAIYIVFYLFLKKGPLNSFYKQLSLVMYGRREIFRIPSDEEFIRDLERLTLVSFKATQVIDLSSEIMNARNYFTKIHNFLISPPIGRIKSER